MDANEQSRLVSFWQYDPMPISTFSRQNSVAIHPAGSIVPPRLSLKGPHNERSPHAPLVHRTLCRVRARLDVGAHGRRDRAAAARRPYRGALRTRLPQPGFTPSWKKPQINKLLVQDWVIFAHMDLPMVKSSWSGTGLLNAAMDWAAATGNGARGRVALGRTTSPIPAGKGRSHRSVLRRDDGPHRRREAFLTLQPTLIEPKAAWSRCTSTPRSAATARESARLSPIGQESSCPPTRS